MACRQYALPLVVLLLLGGHAWASMGMSKVHDAQHHMEAAGDAVKDAAHHSGQAAKDAAHHSSKAAKDAAHKACSKADDILPSANEDNTDQDPRTFVGKVVDSVMGKSHDSASQRVYDMASAVPGASHVLPHMTADAGETGTTPNTITEQLAHEDKKHVKEYDIMDEHGRIVRGPEAEDASYHTKDPRTVVGKVIDSVLGKSHESASQRVSDMVDSATPHTNLFNQEHHEQQEFDAREGHVDQPGGGWVDGIKSAASGVADKVKGAATGAKESVIGAKDSAVGAGEVAGDKVKGAANTAGEYVSSGAQRTKETVQDAAGRAASATKETAGGAADAAKGAASTVGDKARETGEWVADGARSTKDAAADAAKRAAMSAADAAQYAASKVKAGAEHVEHSAARSKQEL